MSFVIGAMFLWNRRWHD